MKLELKHLAPYLPYELKVKDIRLTEGNQYRTLLPWLLPNDPKRAIEIFIPVFRPLSDLIKEIEHNGEKFVPINKLINDSESNYFDDGGLLYGAVKNPEWGQKWMIEFAPYGVMQKLFEWHFDAFDLIDQGLAIDINTLES